MHDGNIQMANEIKHTGTVIAIEDNIVRVKIEQSSACSACQAKAMCTEQNKSLLLPLS
jgi:positive regulator of sigma E activity